MSVFCLHRFALSTNPRIIPAEISRYRLLSMSVSLISRQPMKLQISFGFARAMPTTNPRTGMLWERDWSPFCLFQLACEQASLGRNRPELLTHTHQRRLDSYHVTFSTNEIALFWHCFCKAF